MPGTGAGERLRLPSLGTDSGSNVTKEHRRIVVMGAAKVGKSSIISQFLYDKLSIHIIMKHDTHLVPRIGGAVRTASCFLKICETDFGGQLKEYHAKKRRFFWFKMKPGFTEKYRETVEELHRAEYTLPDGPSLTLDILDTSGAYQFPAMRALSISTANAFILVYAVDDESSWEEVRRLRDLILESRDPSVPIVVVGNKIDLVGAPGDINQPAAEKVQRGVSHELAETTAHLEWECGYVECSAKKNIQIIDVFKELLVVSKVRYNLSPAVRRRRQSLPNYVGNSGGNPAKAKHMPKRHSCTVA